MIEEVKRFEELLTTVLEIDDLQAIEIIIATAVSHKLKWSEMLWLRIIGASGSGKTELLRTLSYEPYATTMETITAGAIRRGFVVKKDDDEPKLTLMQRLNGKLVITKEFGSMLTKNTDAQNEIFGLLRGVWDGETDADYGSEQGHLHQVSHFDWILGTTAYIDSNRSIEYQLGSRFVDLRWESPNNRNSALDKAQANNENLDAIRAKLGRAMADIIDTVEEVPRVNLDYISPLATIAASLRSPIKRDRFSGGIEDIPDIELGTRMAQALARIARGLIMIGVREADIKPYLVRLVFSSMLKIRAKIIQSWLAGNTKQVDISATTGLPQGSISRVVEDMGLVGWQDEWLDILRGGLK